MPECQAEGCALTAAATSRDFISALKHGAASIIAASFAQRGCTTANHLEVEIGGNALFGDIMPVGGWVVP